MKKPIKNKYNSKLMIIEHQYGNIRNNLYPAFKVPDKIINHNNHLEKLKKLIWITIQKIKVILSNLIKMTNLTIMI